MDRTNENRLFMSHVRVLMSRILLIEDHEHLARLIAKGLASAGIAADLVSRADTARAAIRQVSYRAGCSTGVYPMAMVSSYYNVCARAQIAVPA